MQRPGLVPDKYYLKSLHEEIDLFDRKLVHMAKFETFATDAARETAIGKLTTKRATLAKAAQKLAEDGIEFNPSELPRSFRVPVQSIEPTTIAEAKTA